MRRTEAHYDSISSPGHCSLHSVPNTPTYPLIQVLQREEVASEQGVVVDSCENEGFVLQHNSLGLLDRKLRLHASKSEDESPYQQHKTSYLPLGKASGHGITSDGSQQLKATRSTSSGELEREPLSFLTPSHGATTEPVDPAGSESRPTLIDPFGGYPVPSRQDSIESDPSEYLRPGAFMGHRDTLARIRSSPATRGNRTNSTSSGSTLSSPSHSPAQIIHCSYSIVSSSSISSTFSSTIVRPSEISAYGETFGRLHGRNRPVLNIPQGILEGVLACLGFEDYKELRLVCRPWFSRLPLPKFPPSYRCPSEILHQIYYFLAPVDFDAARHTCKSWFLASLDRRLLKIMLGRAGCSICAQTDLKECPELFEARRHSSQGLIPPERDGTEVEDSHHSMIGDLMSEQWLLSKRLATESKISADWRGCGNTSSLAQGEVQCQRLSDTGLVDFSKLLQQRRPSKGSPTPLEPTLFTVSRCGKFVILVIGKMAYIYTIPGGRPTLRACTSVMCPKKVLAVSMDTSSHRYALAILLDGRIGMSCSLAHCAEGAPSAEARGEPMQLGMSTEVQESGTPFEETFEHTNEILGSEEGTASSLLNDVSKDEDSNDALGITTPKIDISTATDVSRSHRSWLDNSMDPCDPHKGAHTAEPSEDYVRIHVENGPRTIFNNLCSIDDPPRSVAICPQRRCIAFGSLTGIELHWVDALTGGDLSRWFPLAAPSDCLYFLPVRHGVDSAKKLRLISSAKGLMSYNQQRQGITPSRWNWRCGPDSGRRRSMTRLFFGNLPFPSPVELLNTSPDAEHPSTFQGQGVLRTVDCDHYRAIPLSDGTHVLFLDPETQYLCLGSDAPLGGPTKLLRKVTFLPPELSQSEFVDHHGGSDFSVGSSGKLLSYTAGQDLRWGIRVVAAYGDGSIMLYSVPPDVFDSLRNWPTDPFLRNSRRDIFGQRHYSMDVFMPAGSPSNAATGSYAVNTSGLETENNQLPVRFPPIHLRGAEVCKLPEEYVVDLAVDASHGGLKVWIFSNTGLVHVRDIYAGNCETSKTSFVDTDGLVKDGEGTSSSPGADGSGKQKKQHVRFSGFDGTWDDFTKGPDVASKNGLEADIGGPRIAPERIGNNTRTVVSVCDRMTPPVSSFSTTDPCSHVGLGGAGAHLGRLSIKMLTDDWSRESLPQPYEFWLE